VYTYIKRGIPHTIKVHIQSKLNKRSIVYFGGETLMGWLITCTRFHFLIYIFYDFEYVEYVFLAMQEMKKEKFFFTSN